MSQDRRPIVGDDMAPNGMLRRPFDRSPAILGAASASLPNDILSPCALGGADAVLFRRDARRRLIDLPFNPAARQALRP